MALQAVGALLSPICLRIWTRRGSAIARAMRSNCRSVSLGAISWNIGRPAKTSPDLAHPGRLGERRIGPELPPRKAAHGVAPDEQGIVLVGRELGDRRMQCVQAAGI